MRTRNVDDLVRLALAQPGGPSYLLLRFVPSPDETKDLWAVTEALPWLGELGEGRISLFDDLRGHGLGVVACPDRQEARQRLRQIRGERVSATLVGHNRKAAPQAQDPDLKRRHGIYPTPPALVGYLVRSVHRLLQSRFGWNAGLADPRVRLLDPAAGAMPFLRAAWRLALEACWHQGGEPGNLLSTHLLPHSLGVELLPEAHTRGTAALRRFLAACGYPLDPDTPLPALLGDSLAPAAVVRDFPANVVFGNPPWRGQSGPRGEWISTLLADYFQVDGHPLGERNSKWLHDDAVRFLRLAQWKVEQAGEGIAALVLPHTPFEAPTFRGLRGSLIDGFDEIYALDLHGNQRKREQSPGGGADENVFRGVAQGAALLVLVKRPGLAKRLLRADLYGARGDKLRTLATTHVGTTAWEEIHPRPTAYLFTSADERLEQEYLRGLPLPKIFPVSTTGVITGRDGMATDLDWKTLVGKLGALRQAGEPGLGLDARRWEALRGDERWPRRVLSFLVRPFDHRYLFYAHYFLERPRQAVMAHMENGGNLALLASRQARGEPGALVTRWIAGHKVVSAYDVSSLFPLYLYPEGRPGPFPEGRPGKTGRDTRSRVPNLAPDLLACLGERYGELPSPEEILAYVYAVLYDPTYRARYRKLLRGDFPRIPFPRERGPFLHLAGLGAELIALHLLADRRLVDPPVGLVGDPRKPLGTALKTFLRHQDRQQLIVNDQGLAFTGISYGVYAYDIGGHPVLRRWLRARCGRVLLPEEILTFRRIASALAFTLDVEAKIAEAGGGLGDAS
jgi:predicted helicase